MLVSEDVEGRGATSGASLPDWPHYLMGFARHASSKSKDSTKVGAALIGQDGRSVMLTGYNGPPSGVIDSPERRERPRKYLFASHAEGGIVAHAARRGIRTEGCSIYVTHFPCSACMRSLIQAGIVAVFYADGATSMPRDEFDAARQMATEVGVRLIEVSDQKD